MFRLDLIIDALEDAIHNFAGDDTEEKLIAALAAARELRALKPVAWVVHFDETRPAFARTEVVFKIDPHRGSGTKIPLYALEVKHD